MFDTKFNQMFEMPAVQPPNNEVLQLFAKFDKYCLFIWKIFSSFHTSNKLLLLFFHVHCSFNYFHCNISKTSKSTFQNSLFSHIRQTYNITLYKQGTCVLFQNCKDIWKVWWIKTVEWIWEYLLKNKINTKKYQVSIKSFAINIFFFTLSLFTKWFLNFLST